MPPPHHPPGAGHVLTAALACLAGTLGVGAVWGALGTALGQAAGWMALVAAADAVLLLRLVRFPPGRAAAALAAATVAATWLLANWVMAAAAVGPYMGLALGESMLRIGAHHAWSITRLAHAPLDFALVWLALVAAAALAGLSARRRAT